MCEKTRGLSLSLSLARARIEVCLLERVKPRLYDLASSRVAKKTRSPNDSSGSFARTGLDRRRFELDYVSFMHDADQAETKLANAPRD